MVRPLKGKHRSSFSLLSALSEERMKEIYGFLLREVSRMIIKCPKCQVDIMERHRWDYFLCPLKIILDRG